MSRIHIALNTSRFDESLAFYSKLFDTAPAKVRDNWAKFDLQEPALNFTLNRSAKEPGQGEISHLGIEVEDSDAVARIDRRLRDIGLKTLVEDEVTCCYAVQDKTWVQDPDGHSWEFFFVRQDAEEGGEKDKVQHAAGACC